MDGIHSFSAHSTHLPLFVMNIAKMMQQAQQMQSKMQVVQAELAARTVDASVAGKVSVTANGAGRI